MAHRYLAGALLLTLALSPGAGRTAEPVDWDWNLHAKIHPDLWSGEIMVRLEDDLGARVEGTRIVGPSGVLVDLGDLAPVVGVEQGFGLDPQRLQALRDRVRDRCGCRVPDLTAWFRVEVPREQVELPVLLERLNSLQVVEVAYPLADRSMIPRPEDYPPTTPSWESDQGYLDPAPGGVDARYAWTVPGGRGEGIAVVDVEAGWDVLHEDLVDACRYAQMDGIGTIDLSQSDLVNHGTAVLGVVLGGDNGYGVTGIAPDATCRIAPDYTLERGYSIALALAVATEELEETGGVILLEAQTSGPNYDPYSGSHDGLVPVEWEPAIYESIRLAVHAGIVVVEAAGNGREDLDDTTYYGEFFHRDHRDSGAIIVGAGTPSYTSPARAPEWYSNWGSRVDVQGWGSMVYTAGYGDLFTGSGDVHQLYTAQFGGTSSASPVVTGAVAAMLGAMRAFEVEPLDPLEVREILVETGTPQHPDVKNIGPLPDLRQALGRAVPICGDGIRSVQEACDDGNDAGGDGCSADCLSDETCGNEIVDLLLLEVCDDGNTVGGDGCSADCLSDETCGNGFTDADVGEVCDDGNAFGGDGCSMDCLSDETCGNGILDPTVGEVCDDGNVVGGDGCSMDCLSDETCGNGILDTAAGERCDDGNLENEDGCSSTCRKEGGCGCSVLPGASRSMPWMALLAIACLLLARMRQRRAT